MCLDTVPGWKPQGSWHRLPQRGLQDQAQHTRDTVTGLGTSFLANLLFGAQRESPDQILQRQLFRSLSGLQPLRCPVLLG